MSDNKPVASLGPLLLARKGTAKPAMRVHMGDASRGSVADLDDYRVDALAASQEDLGWNDMGHDHEPTDAEVGIDAQAPEVKRQMAKLVHRIADSNLAAMRADERQQTKGSPRKTTTASAECGRRAAFTLRLDDERHLRLRLASTVGGESAQALVTRALDHLLASMPEIEQLASQVRPKGRRGASKA